MVRQLKSLDNFLKESRSKANSFKNYKDNELLHKVERSDEIKED
jgi:hypothetical protein